MPVKKVAATAEVEKIVPSRPSFLPYHAEQGHLCKRIAELVASGTALIALISEPGMGKSAFLRDLQMRHPGSPLVRIRQPLGTHTAEGFWTAMLNQLGIRGDKKVPKTVHEMAELVADTLSKSKSKDKPLLILIDGLENAPELLDSCGVAGFDWDIDQVVTIVAIRPGICAEELVAGGATPVIIDPHSEENREELLFWLSEQFDNDDSGVIHDIVSHSEGNFMVAAYLAKGVLNGTIAAHDLEQSPSELVTVFSSMLDSLVMSIPSEEQEDAVSVLCMLAEAGEPLPAMSLADFLGFSSSRVRRLLARLAQVLHVKDDCYTIFNSRMSSVISQHYSRTMAKVHRQVITYFRVTYPSWEDMDDRYGWFYLGHHCDRLARVSRHCDFSALHMLGEGPYIGAKLDYTKSISAVLKDLRRCLKASLEEESLSRIVSYGLRIPRLRAMHAANGLHDLADMGLYELAMERARLLRSESSRMKAYLLLAWQASEDGKCELARSILNEASQIVQPDIIPEERLLTAFIVADLIKRIPYSEVLPIIFNIVSYEQVAEIIFRVAILRTLDVPRRKEVLRRGLDYVSTIDNQDYVLRWTECFQLISAKLKEEEDDDCTSIYGRELISEINRVSSDYGENEAIGRAFEILEEACATTDAASPVSKTLDEATTPEMSASKDVSHDSKEEGQSSSEGDSDSKSDSAADNSDDEGSDERSPLYEAAEEASLAIERAVSKRERIVNAYRAALELVSNVRWESRKVGAIAAFTKILIRHSDEDWVAAAFDELVGVIVSVHLPEERQKATVAVTRLVTGQTSAKGWRDVFERLSALIETFENPRLRVRAWAWLALALYEARDYKGAISVLSKAASLAFHITDPTAQGNELALLSSCAVAIGHANTARNLAYHCLQVCEAPSNSRVDAEVRAALVVGASANVSEEKSLEYLSSSIQAAQGIPDMRVRASLLVALAGGVAKLGEADWARRVQNQALGVARAMEPGATQAKTLASLAVQEYAWGEVYRADQICREAEIAANDEENGYAQREALMAVAVAHRVGGREGRARELLKRVIDCLAEVSSEELANTADVVQVATLATECKQRDAVIALLERLSNDIINITGERHDSGLLKLTNAWLLLKEFDKARASLSHITDIQARIKGRILLAVALIRTHHDEAIDILSRIPIFEERMRGVRECATALLSDRSKSRRQEVLHTLSQLTMMAVEDEATADYILGRWIGLNNNRQAVLECAEKLGYSIEDLLAGNMVEPMED